MRALRVVQYTLAKLRRRFAFFVLVRVFYEFPFGHFELPSSNELHEGLELEARSSLSCSWFPLTRRRAMNAGHVISPTKKAKVQTSNIDLLS